MRKETISSRITGFFKAGNEVDLEQLSLTSPEDWPALFRVLALLLILCLVLGFAWLFYLNGQNSHLDKLRHTERKQKSTFVAYIKGKDRTQTLLAQQETLKAHLFQLKTEQNNEDKQTFITQLNDQANKNSLDSEKITLVRYDAKKDHTLGSIAVTAQGTFESIDQFIQDIVQLDSLYEITQISMKIMDARTGENQIKLNMSIQFFKYDTHL